MLHSALLPFCSRSQPAPGSADANTNKSKPGGGEQFWISTASGGTVTKHRLQRHVRSRTLHNEHLTLHKYTERKCIPTQNCSAVQKKQKCMWEEKNTCKRGCLVWVCLFGFFFNQQKTHKPLKPCCWCQYLLVVLSDQNPAWACQYFPCVSRCHNFYFADAMDCPYWLQDC